MSKTFKVGDVAIIQNMTHYLERNGTEVTIIGNLQLRHMHKYATG